MQGSHKRDSFIDVCSEQVRVNRSFVEMKVVYDPCEAPREKKRGAGASVSSAKTVEESAAKRTKKSETGSSDSRAVKAVLSKASRHSGAA